MASRVERAGFTAHPAPAPAVATAGKSNLGRRPNKKARSGSASGEAVADSPARTDVSDSPARTISGSPGRQMAADQHFGANSKLASGSEPAVTSRHVTSMAPVQEAPPQAASSNWQADEQFSGPLAFAAAQTSLPAGAINEMLHDPIAAAIKNATDAITTDGALQASGDLTVHGLNTQPHLSQDIVLPHTSIQTGNVPPDQLLPQETGGQQLQLSYQMPSGEVTLDNQPNSDTYPMQSDGTVTITTSRATPEGATVLVRQPEGLLIVRDAESGKEQCLGKLLGNSKQTSLILQAANFLEPCS